MTEQYISEIMKVGFNFAPREWATCDGQLMAIASNSALFSLLGTTFGGDGRTTFALPDLRGRVIRHVGNGPGLQTVNWGEKGGRTEVTMTVSQMPSHNHLMYGSNEEYNTGSPVNALPGTSPGDGRGGFTTPIYVTGKTPNLPMNGFSITNNGTGNPYSIQNPTLGIYTCIALYGIFPSRH